MSELRCRPTNIILNAANVEGSAYAYYGVHTMPTMMAIGYFQAEHNRLRVGDTIRLVACERGINDRISRVTEMAECMVTESSREGVRLVAMPGYPYSLDLPAEEVAEVEPLIREIYADDSWTAVDKGPAHKWWVLDGDGKDVIRGLSETEAKDIANGHAPLPQKAA